MIVRLGVKALVVGAAIILFGATVHAGNEPSDPEQEITKRLRGDIDPKSYPDFARIGAGWLDKEAGAQLRKMLACLRDPRCSGLKREHKVYICSAFRSYRGQQWGWIKHMRERSEIGDPKRRADNTLRFYAMPGTSRHHWGTDVDLSFVRGECMFSNHYFRSAAENRAMCERRRKRCRARRAKRIKASCKTPALCNRQMAKAERACNVWIKRCFKRDGRAAAIFHWLRTNGPKYGFCQPYRGFPEERNPGVYKLGYLPERWHWSYCCKAKQYLRDYKARLKALEPSMKSLFGRHGGPRYRAAYDAVIKEYPEYVLNVHPSCHACQCPKP